jgi:hypothetical protein
VDRHLSELPVGWAVGQGNRPATLELFGLLRAGRAEEACELAVEQLLGGVGAQSVWDAVHLASAELMVRHNSGWGVASRPLHSNTSASALHYAFRTSGLARTRLLSLLQAVAWTGDKTNSELRDGSLRDIELTQLRPPRSALPVETNKAVAEVFSLLPERHYEWDGKAQRAITTYGNRDDADEACNKSFALAVERPVSRSHFVQAALSWMCQKASSDAHDYKFPAAIFEDMRWVSLDWQPHLLAASIHFLHGERSPDHPVIQQSREALRTNA